ncbi:hypothetical protein JCM10213_007265 [Rhodosporidiobolus nylandii]
MAASALPPLTLYSARICPWAQRTTLALCEVGAYENGQVEHVEIDLQNKPEWYASKVNPASKVPVLQIGKEGEPNTKYIPESGPADPIERAEARYFAERFTQVVTGPLMAIAYRGEDKSADVLKGVEEIQTLLAKHDGTFLLGEQISIGDLAVAPFVGRVFANGKGGLIPSDLYNTLNTDAKYAPFKAYRDALVSRPSWAATFDEDYVIHYSRKRIEKMRAEAAAQKQQ